MLCLRKMIFMKNFNIGIAISTLLIFPLNVRADFDLLDSSPSFGEVTKTNSINSGLDKYRTPDNNWGKIGEEAEVDLSEWGGKAPTCAEAPECPVCIK